MYATTEIIKSFCNQETEHKDLVGRKCVIKPSLMEEGLKGECKIHYELCSGNLTIIATQLDYKGELAVRVQNDKIKNLHPGCGDLLNSFIKSMDEIDLIEEV